MKRGKLVALLLAAFSLVALEGLAEFAKVPDEALKALKKARGRAFNDGVVFVDGKYIPPPYVVSRYGTAITINDIQVTSQVVPWEEFLKTQSGVTVSRSETSAEEAPLPEEPEAEEEEELDEDDPLADLFDDEPKPAKKAAKKKSSYRRAPKKPTVTTTYKLEGEFVPNDDSKKLLDRIDRYRTDVNRKLAAGGFVFFGSAYAPVVGPSRETKRLLEKLPGMMKRCSTGAELYAEARRQGFSAYITETIANELVKNRYLYTQLEQRYQKLQGGILSITD